MAAPTGVLPLGAPGGHPRRRIRVGGTPTHRPLLAHPATASTWAAPTRTSAVIDRYAGERIGDIRIPGSAAGLRVAPYGGWLLARPAEGDTIWVVDLATGRFAGALRGPWATDLPTVLGDATPAGSRGG